MKTIPQGKTRHSLAVLLAPLLLLATSLTHAQNFESFYGEKDTRDAGADVKAAKYCGGGGSIIVGSRQYDDGISEVLATRVDDAGVALWQRAYRVAGSKQSTANAVVELNNGKGFVLTGAVTLDPAGFIYVMQVDCGGKLNWATLLQNQKADYHATGYDIIQSGASASTDAVGDLIVIGDEVANLQSGAGFGRIARLTSSGTLIWDQAYIRTDIPFGLRFRAVAENLASSGAPTDLVVAGSAADASNWNAERRGLIFRVNASGAPVCNAILGAQGENKDFFGLTALHGAGFSGDSALVGATAKVNGVSAAYLVRFTSGGCTPKVQSVWSDPRDANVIAYDAVEVLDRDAGPGSVVATGTISGAWTTGEGFVLAAQSVDLLQYAPLTPKRFGSQSDTPENLFAIDLKADRFVLAGTTYTDWESVGDPQDVYFVQTDPGMNTKCSVVWEPKVARLDLTPKRFTPRVIRLPAPRPVDVEQIEAGDEGYCCKKDPPPGCPGVIDNGTVQLGVSDTGYLNVECDTSTMSTGRYGTTLVGLRYLPTNGDASAPGAPCEGWGVASADLGVSGSTSRCAGTANVVVDSFAASTSTATSVVHIGNTFRVTHQYVPTSVTPYLYEVDVSIQNIGNADVADLRYTRGIDYDVPPNAFSEYITISGSASPFVLASNDNGFNSLDPLAINSGMPGDFTDHGPGDLGAHFDFALGTLKAGQTRSFVTYYGAAKDESSALSALTMVGAGIYSLGEADWDGTGCFVCSYGPPGGTYGAATGAPATFMYGFVPRIH